MDIYARNQMESQLALTPKPGALKNLFEHLRDPRVKPSHLDRPEVERHRELSSMLGFAQPVELLVDFIKKYGDEEFAREIVTCWIQEAVLRAQIIDGNGAIESYWRSVNDRGHVLAQLPLGLLPFEHRSKWYMPQYRPGFTGWESPEFEKPRALRERHGYVPPAKLVTCSMAQRAAVKSWEEHSNGRIESAVFEFDTPLAKKLPPEELVAALPLESTESVAMERLTVLHESAALAWHELFCAASQGGAYGGSCYGAYGRLHAWQSMAAMCGADVASVPTEISRRAEKCQWAGFMIETEWFCHVAWDLALLCVRPDRLSVASLMATDTD